MRNITKKERFGPVQLCQGFCSPALLLIGPAFGDGGRHMAATIWKKARYCSSSSRRGLTPSPEGLSPYSGWESIGSTRAASGDSGQGPAGSVSTRWGVG